MQKQLVVFLAMMMVAGGVTAGVSAVLIIAQDSSGGPDVMPAFTSYDDLAGFMGSENGSGPATGGRLLFGSPSANQDKSYGSVPDFSQTNVRTAGVDEADTVKTDGEYIYSATWDSVRIIKAYPPSDVSIVSYVNATELISILKDTDLMPRYDNYSLSAGISGIFIASGRLIVISSVYQWYNYSYDQPFAVSYYMPWTPDMQKSVVFVFNIEDPSAPAFEDLYATTGYPLTSRLQGGFLYSMSQMTIWKGDDDKYGIPKVTENGVTSEMEVTDIHYDPDIQGASSFLTILAIDLATGKTESKAVVGDWSSTIYKSLESLFVTYVKWNWDSWGPIFAGGNQTTDLVTTTIYKIAVDGLSLHISARGDVKGILNDQFSMDEKDGYLRLAVNNGEWGHRLNAVYVLDSNLEIVGSIEGIAANETIQSARFVGDTLYLVTFRQIDPLFVIDLSNPFDPKVLGELTMPGFSSYLHPVDDNHVLGIGRENTSLKISLYDVSDPTNPYEDSKFLTDEGVWAYSNAQWDYKAVLFSAEKGILVIPVMIHDYSTINHSSQDGFFVFDVSVDQGISLRGVVSHDNQYSYNGRALYIGDYLYTITESMMKVSALSNLGEVAVLPLPSSNNYYVVYRSPTMVE